jgi:DNA-binding winged helix-turn-helix (wHTH) protein/tetratricopeptide (TPR) repeat protein
MISDLFRFQDFELDRNAYELRRSGQSVRLERIPYELLSLLIERRGQLVTREEIIERIWGKDVFHDTEHGINTAIRKIRQALRDDPDAPRFVLTVPAKGYRFVAPVEVEKVEPAVAAGPPVALGLEKVPLVEGPRRRSYSRILIPAALFLLAFGVAAFFHFHRVQALTEKDTIVIADFANSTGDAVFDDTLKQALSVELSQSPFINILSDEKMAETMQMMGHSADERVNEKTAMEICQRTQSTAVLRGSIARLGKQYVVGMSVVNCRTGDFLAKQQVEASSQEDVLKTVDHAAANLRGRLGESLASIQRFNTPVEQATTPSLEALQAYSLGCKQLMGGDDVAAVPFFQRAISLDPNFAVAYALLGTSYANLGELNLAAENTTRAYELREKVSERERLYIDSHYHMFVTGSVEKGRQTFELWSQVYPRDDVPTFNLGAMYGNIGQFDKALEKARESLRLDPESGMNYSQLVYCYLALNRVLEAQATAEEAQSKKLDSPSLQITLYMVAFLQNDSKAMAKQVAWGAGKPGVEDVLLAFDADSAAYFGRLRRARELTRRAVVSAEQAEEKETAAIHEAEAALREALFGNVAEARSLAAKVSRPSTGEDVQFAAALTSAIAGDTAKGQALADDLANRLPEDTFVQFTYVPTIRAQLALTRNDPSEAIEALQVAAPYELGDLSFARLNPVYVRGEAYLAAHRGTEASAEFQKILDHRGVVANEPIGALAHLQIGRAYAMQGDTTKARAAYQDFLTLWKDADPDIPILIAAKSEYAKLK